MDALNDISPAGAELERIGTNGDIGLLKATLSTGKGNTNINALLAGMLGTGAASANLEKALSKPTSNKLNKSMSTIERTGPGLFTRTVLRYLTSSSPSAVKGDGADDGGVVLVLPTQSFYPVPNTVGTITREILNQCICPDITLAVHHWAKSWQ